MSSEQPTSASAERRYTQVAAPAPETFRPGHFVLPDLCKIQPLFVLIVTAELLVLVHTLLLGTPKLFDWSYFSRASFYAQWNVLLCAAALCHSRRRIQSLPFTNGAVLAYGLILLVSLLFNLLVQWLLQRFMPALAPGGWNFLLTAKYLAAVAVMGGIALRYMYLQQQLQVQQQAQLQARIQALQSRIRPHFLFNSMNIVASLIGFDPKRAERVVEDIAELFRASLRAGDELIPLRDELALCKRYIDIEQLRLGERLQVQWDVDEQLLDERLPSLTVQPLIENAVYHGVQPLAEGGLVEISGTLIENRVTILISNPLPEPNKVHGFESTRGNRMALGNTVARLQAHFGPDAGVKTISDQNRFSAEISYAVKKQH